MRRRHDGDMAHVYGQLRQVGLHIGALEVPAEEHADREAVSEIMNAGTPAFAVLHMRRLEQGADSATDPGAGVGMEIAFRIDEKGCVGILAERWSETLLKIALQFGVRVSREG